MVGKEQMPSPLTPIEDLAGALHGAYPELDALRGASGTPVYLVGGAVRDLLLGRGRADIDLVVVGNAAGLAAELGAETLAEHERFATAKVEMDGHVLDVAGARSETYAHPGALPEVAPAPDVEADLARRDFTVNAMAIPLRGEPRLIDPYAGLDDLEAARLRILHPRSFLDDPTRAIRAARYGARFDFALEARTGDLMRAADLGTVSADRRRVELLRLAAEPTAPRGLELLAGWGLIETREDGIELAAKVDEVLAMPLWRGRTERADAVLAAALGPPGGELDLAAATPARPSQAVALAAGKDPVELALARALGAEWLDEYLERWRSVELEIDGVDLIAAGVAQGPGLGRGLRAALRAKLDGEVHGREQELAAALAAASGE
jgi:tRNA nucleotidyltransferase (CCA-adding enzyme)